MGTSVSIPADLHFTCRACSRHAECIGWAMLNTVAAMVTYPDRMWVMTVLTLKVTALQKDNEPVSRPVNAREVKGFTDRCGSKVIAHAKPLLVYD